MAKILKITVKNAKITVKIPKIFAPPARFPYPHTPNQNSTYATGSIKKNFTSIASHVTPEIPKKKHGKLSKSYLMEQSAKFQLRKFCTIENTIMKIVILHLYSIISS